MADAASAKLNVTPLPAPNATSKPGRELKNILTWSITALTGRIIMAVKIFILLFFKLFVPH
jgi:hypothetical protein